MKILKKTLVAALIVPAFAMSALAFDNHGGDDEKKAKMEAKRAEHMKMMQEKCAKAEDTAKCMANAKAAMKKKAGENMGEHKGEKKGKKKGQKKKQ